MGNILKAIFFGLMPLFELTIFVKSIIYFNVIHYARHTNKDIITKLGLFARHDKYAVAWQDKGHTIM